MPLVTLTTDYGLQDHYVAALKGQIYAANPGLTIVDLNHNIPHFDIIKAAFALKNSAPKYPKGTLHFVSINIKEGNNRILLVERDDRFYMCPDNGFISLLFPDEKFKAYVLNDLEGDYSYEDIYETLSRVVDVIESNNPLESIGRETNSYMPLRHMQPIVSEDMITGSVFYIDSFQNVFINVTKEQFEEVIGKKPFTIEFRNYKIHKLYKHYNQVPEGEFLCLFNDAGFLEIAINKGNAAGLLGMEYGSSVIIEGRNVPVTNSLGIHDH